MIHTRNAYMMTAAENWTILNLEFDGDVVRAELFDGVDAIEIIAGVYIDKRRARLEMCHFQGEGSNLLGARRLMALARWAKGVLDVDELRIEGATRTSGACPGRRPRPLVF